MRNLFQIRDAFLRSTLLWMGLGALVIWRPDVTVTAIVVSGVAIMLYKAIPPNGKDAALFAHLLAIWAYSAAAAAALLIADRLGLPLTWPWAAVAVGIAWAITTLSGLRLYHGLITIPPGVMYIYTSLAGQRRVAGYAKVAPHLKLLERLQVIVPTVTLRHEVTIMEIATVPAPTANELARHFDDRGPPGEHGAIHNVHRLQLGIDFALDPKRFYAVLSIPQQDILAEQRERHTSPERSPWHTTQFWAGIACGYLQRQAEQLTRTIVAELCWSPHTVRWRQHELAGIIFERLAKQAAEYGLIVHAVHITHLAVDNPEAVRRSRDLELLFEMAQGTQARALGSFHHALTDLGLNLTAQEIEELTRLHLHNLVEHVNRSGEADELLDDLLATRRRPRLGSPSHEATHQRRKAA